jgi:Na+/H+ antiporter NhaD/arsenite permease-like protein
MLHQAIDSISELKTLTAYMIFFCSYLVFAIGKFPGMKIDRTGAAIIGAVLMFAFGIIAPHDSLRFIEFSTLVLPFSMMLIVAYLHKAGFFELATYIAVSRLKPHHMLPTIIFTTGLLSAFLVNDIICLAMVPVVLQATRRLNVKPLPYLLTVATASNIGSVATITGDPQNILIGSYSGIGYIDFLCRLGPVAIVGLFINWGVIHFTCKRWFTESDSAKALDPLTKTEQRNLIKPAIVILLVLAGFLVRMNN